MVVHDPNAIFKFDEHDVYIPLTVIDELDKFKDEQGRRGWSAREFFRVYDALDTDAMHDPRGGAPLGNGGGRLFVFNTELRLKRIAESGSLAGNLADNTIIRSAQKIKDDNGGRRVVLVTKDRGMLIRARGWECLAENYRSDLVQESVYTGTREVQIHGNADWEVLWGSGDEVDSSNLSESVRSELASVNPNEAVIFAWGESMFPTLYKGRGVFRALGNAKMDFCGIKPKNLEQRCAMAMLADTTIPFIALSGAAGTGKTLCALAVTLHQIANEEYDRLIFIKPVTPVGGKDIGFLPGSKQDKLLAWLGPLSDNIDQIVGNTSQDGRRPVEVMMEDGKIDAEAMTYIQGRSIARSVIVCDETQNLKSREARMLVERCGPGSRVIMLGDLSQIEDPYLDRRSCGLAHAIEGGRKHPLAASMLLTKVERSPLAAAAGEIFDRPEAQR